MEFAPRSSEECALSFRILSKDIIGLSQTQIDFLMAFEQYLLTGNDYMTLNLNTALPEIAGMPIQYGYSSKYIKRYNNIKNLEQYLADKLAEITYNNPYEYAKNTNECWTSDCKSQKCICKLEEVQGSKNPIARFSKCNKNLLNHPKTEAIIRHSLFGGIYDAIDLLIGIQPKFLNAKLLNGIVKKY